MADRTRIGLTVSALVSIAFAGVAPAQVVEDCATTFTEHEAALALDMERAGMYTLRQFLAPGEFVYVPLALHVVRRSDGSGGLSQAQLDQAAIDVNIGFDVMGVRFCQAGPVDYIDNDNFYFNTNSTAMINALRSTNVVPGAINVYFVPNPRIGTSAICGISSFTFSAVQGIVMNNACTGLASNPSTYPHEIGHYFDLFHTHESAFGQECVSGANCVTAGDLVCDTPADPVLTTSNVSAACNYVGGSFGPCPGDGQHQPSVRNLMSYSRKTCRDEFSDGQNTRSLATLFNLRLELHTTILRGDATGDGKVGFDDVGAVLAGFGQSGPNLPGDLNRDGVVDFADLGIVLGEFGMEACAGF